MAGGMAMGRLSNAGQVNQKPETRNPNEAPNPKPEIGVDCSFLGFPSGLSLRVEDWF